ncbi:MAG: potassium-transporting ATPase subunit C [Mesorhizobium amorphae]|nr:MAG: potassium-transporting ATPase subunit C [Mesorhizobium amorphae]
MLAHLRPALVLTVLFTLLTGIAYPFALTGAAQSLMPLQANGSPVTRDGQVVGSALIGQSFTSARYFQGRPSASAETPYNAAASSGSNLAPSATALVDAVRERVSALGATGPVPTDLVTASGSGLDPDISPEAAAFQVARVAEARGLPPERVRALVEEQARGLDFGVIGQPRVNVLALNLALDALQP